MKNSMFFLIMLLTTYSAVAECTKIEGEWGLEQQHNDIINYTTLSIDIDSITATTICTGFGKTATAQVRSRSSYTDFSLTILEKKMDQNSNGELNCQATLENETMSYSIVGNYLVLNNLTKKTSLFFIKK